MRNFFRQLDEPELGAILVCEADDHVAELSAPAVEMSRAKYPHERRNALSFPLSIQQR